MNMLYALLPVAVAEAVCIVYDIVMIGTSRQTLAREKRQETSVPDAENEVPEVPEKPEEPEVLVPAESESIKEETASPTLDCPKDETSEDETEEISEEEEAVSSCKFGSDLGALLNVQIPIYILYLFCVLYQSCA